MGKATLDLRRKEEVSVRKDALHLFVFGRIGYTIAFILLLFFIFQPVAFAYEPTETSEENVVEVFEPEPEVVEEVETEEVTAQEEIPEDVTASAEAVVPLDQSPVSTEDTPYTDEVLPDSDEATTTEELDDSVEVVVPEDSEEESVEDTEEVTDVDTSEEVHIEDVSATTTEESVATTTSTTTESVEVEAHTVMSDSNKYQFGSTECVAVGDGAFYCAKQTAPPSSTSVREDGLIAAPDKDGDLEIYVIKDGKHTQITHNTYDDAAPFYDEAGGTIVWHRLIDDRYQIMRYDLKDQTEEQLTNTSDNNMEPTAHDGIVVWQSWVLNNWEIMMEEGGKITQLSQNEVHDIAPHINAEYIVWQTQLKNEWYAHVYNRKTGKTEEIRNENGHMIENPRFVLVYDARHDNGDVETLGYDLETGKIVPLSAVPTKTPADIPEPDQTGEERALIQSKPKVEEETADMIPEGNGFPEPELASSTPSTTQSTSSQPVAAQPIEPEVEVSTSTAAVPDLVIPAFTPEE